MAEMLPLALFCCIRENFCYFLTSSKVLSLISMEKANNKKINKEKKLIKTESKESKLKTAPDEALAKAIRSMILKDREER